MENTEIAWATHTFNPWRGCEKVSPGCAHCYAEAMSRRNPAVLGEWGPNGTRVIASESAWREPLKWDRAAAKAGARHRVFCASMADVFEDRPELVAPRVRLFHLISETRNLDWLLLTKRPENINRFCGDATTPWTESPPPNCWLGVSVEDQARADERIPLLLKTPAAVRFLSCEPLLGPIDLRPKAPDAYRILGQFYSTGTFKPTAMPPGPDRVLNCFPKIDWVIIGGESGHHSRPCDVAWIRSIVQQCKAAGVACFVKQLGARPLHDGRTFGPHDDEDCERCWRCGHFDFGPCADGTLLCNGCNAAWDRLRDRKGGDMTEWAEDLRVREFPEVQR